MDYTTWEHRYNQALERARGIHDGNPSSGTAITVCEEIFPELSESEDERIFKDIIQFFKDASQSKTRVITSDVFKKWADYLEKQKEDKEYDLDFAKQLEALRKVQREKNLDELIEMRWSVLSDNDKAEISKDSFIHQAKFFFEVGYEKQEDEEGVDFIPVESTLEYKIGFKAGKDFEKHQMKKCSGCNNFKGCSTCIDYNNWAFVDYNNLAFIDNEQKPTEWNKKPHRVCEDTIEAIDKDREMREQHPELYPAEWSEEDTLHLTNAILSAEKEWGKDSCTAKWLNELPNRFNPQPKQEWSEEDEENFEWFDKLFRAESVIAGGRDIPQDKYLWFKSLRPSWKPNEEQMNAIDYVLRYDKTGEFRDALKSLYDQLWKLQYE